MRPLEPELADRILNDLRAHPDGMLLELARKYQVPELAILGLLGPPRAVKLDAARWPELMEALPALGSVRVLVSNSGVTMETRGRFGGFSRTGDYFNVQTSTLDLHLRGSAIGGAMAVEKPSHQTGRPTASVQLFDHEGAAILKIFLLFGEDDGPEDTRRQLFAALRDSFSAP